MPFQVFRRHQRKILAFLAIFAMFGFVLADSLPRFLQDRPTNFGGPDQVVARLYGRPVRESDLERLRGERARANYALSQLAPYFTPETFGPTDMQSIVDAYILEHEADQLGIPSSPQMAKTWIFEQAEQQHNLLRLFNRGLPEYDPELVSQQLETVYSQVFKRQVSDLDFLKQIANQIRIRKVRDLIAPALSTPLDSFRAYGSEQLRVEAKYVAFPASDYLSKVTESPDEATLRAFFDEHKNTVPDPSTGQFGFKIPRRLRLEFLTLGLNAVDLLEEQVRSRPLADEIRGDSGFTRDVASAYAADQANQGDLGQLSLPAFLFNDDPNGSLTPPPATFVDRYVAEQVDRRVEELLREEIDLVFESVRSGMYDFVDELEQEQITVNTGLELKEDRIPRLDTLLGEAGKKLEAQLGPASARAEGISFTRLGLTRLLADPDRVRNLVGPDGLTPDWQTYLDLVGIDWSSFAVRRQALELLQSSLGLDRPSLSSEATPFPATLFQGDASLFEPREYTDPIGRRYLVWVTLDLPEFSPPFNKVRRDLVVAEWRQDQARKLARKDAESLVAKITGDSADASPVDALARLAEGKAVQSTGLHTETDPPQAYLPIQAGPELLRTLYSLSDSGQNRALVAPDQDGDTFFAFVLASRRDRSLPADASSTVDFRNALNNLSFYKNTVDRQETVRRDNELMQFLRKKAGLDPNWTPPERSGSSQG